VGKSDEGAGSKEDPVGAVSEQEWRGAGPIKDYVGAVSWWE
jgi:hypothetical protein